MTNKKQTKHRAKLFVDKSSKRHAGKYTYDKVIESYVNQKTKVLIGCPEHGDFLQRPDQHLAGKGCYSCGKKTMAEKRKMPLKTFIEKATEIHGGKYIYNKVSYNFVKDKIIITCPTHGDFLQKGTTHLSGHGCKKCCYVSTSEFISRAKEIHGDLYDYSKVLLASNIKSKVPIGCKTHGDFEQCADNHLQGYGCPVCGRASGRRLSLQEAQDRSSEVHEGLYACVGLQWKEGSCWLILLCKTHGEFTQRAQSHFGGGGCQSCENHNKQGRGATSQEQFIAQSQKIGDGLGHSKVDYKSSHTPVILECKKHGDVSLTPSNRLSKQQGCPRCCSQKSKQEEQVLLFIESLVEGSSNRNRSLIGPLELDIVVPSKKLAIEYNGSYWHSTATGKDRNYHLNKTKACNDKGYDLIHIWDYLWHSKRDIYESIIKCRLGIISERIYARKTEIKQVPVPDAKVFLNNNHLKGYLSCQEFLGLYYKDELVSLVGLSYNRGKFFGSSKEAWELVRFATKLNCSVVGGLSKLIKHFNKTLLSYCDLSTFNGKGYESSGFVLSHNSDPGYYYTSNHEIHLPRYKAQKSKLSNLLPNFDENLTEKENMELNKYYRVFDCGNAVYTYTP